MRGGAGGGGLGGDGGPLCPGNPPLPPLPPCVCTGSSLQGADTSRLQVRLGELNMLSAGEPLPHQDAAILEVVLHPGFDNLTKESDLALVRLDRGAGQPRQPHIVPVCLPSSGDTLAGRRAIVTGWGKVSWCQHNYRKILLTPLLLLAGQHPPQADVGPAAAGRGAGA